MIQTLLIILFIIVPIFLLLDKVTTAAGVGAALGQARRGQALHLPSPGAHPLTRLCSLTFVHSVLSAPHPLTPGPQPLTPAPSPRPLPSLALLRMGWGAANALFSIPCPARMTARLGWMKTTPTR